VEGSGTYLTLGTLLALAWRECGKREPQVNLVFALSNKQDCYPLDWGVSACCTFADIYRCFQALSLRAIA
jgi:hypothetical protein